LVVLFRVLEQTHPRAVLPIELQLAALILHPLDIGNGVRDLFVERAGDGALYEFLNPGAEAGARHRRRIRALLNLGAHARAESRNDRVAHESELDAAVGVEDEHVAGPELAGRVAAREGRIGMILPLGADAHARAIARNDEQRRHSGDAEPSTS